MIFSIPAVFEAFTWNHMKPYVLILHAFAQMRSSSIIECASLFPSLFDSLQSLHSREIFGDLVWGLQRK